jgi:NADPH-dependent 2,4-dienoyl-CoA reductase/sulfur reductase-like enzyme
MKHYDVIIVGAGPAGIAAAKAARRAGSSLVVIDDNHGAGGQIWRGSAIDLGCEFLSGARVIDGDADGKHITVERERVFQLSYSKLILCTGARELFLPFPGWTLPNVFGVGGLQALAKSGLNVARKRVVVAGSGPLLLAVAAYLQDHGATVPVIAEQASWGSLAKFGVSLLQHPGKIRQAMEIRKSLSKTRYLPNTWVTSAWGGMKLESVTFNDKSEERCDYLAIAYGFVPNTELAQLMGCKLNGGFVLVDEKQQTSVPDIYSAGEPTGLGGVDESLLEGEIAGGTQKLSRRRTSHFSRALQQAFVLRPELKGLASPGTIVCRCEDVTYGRLRRAASWREAKLHYRCGMGPCQGRICGPIVEHCFGWAAESVRPPIFSTKLENLIAVQETTHT